VSRRAPRSDDRTVQALEKELGRERAATRKADLRWAMENPRGRRLLAELIFDPVHGCAFDEAPVTGNGSEAFAFAARRAVAKKLVDRLERETPEEYLELRRERLEAKQEMTRLREDAAAPETPDRSD
jgi:hypothetical protein